MVLTYKPEHIAVALLYFTLQVYGLEVPYARQSRTPWWETLSDSVTLPIMRDICTELTDMYDLQVEFWICGGIIVRRILYIVIHFSY